MATFTNVGLDATHCAGLTAAGTVGTVAISEIDPIADRRWEEFVQAHPESSVFHTVGWLKALRKTHDLVPFSLVRFDGDGAVSEGMVACRVNSWLTGRRIVSLPFSDHCQPLVSEDRFSPFLDHLTALAAAENRKHAEIRPTIVWTKPAAGWAENVSCHLHLLDLTPGKDGIFRAFHRDGIQRRIKRAQKEDLVTVSGRSPELLEAFYKLVVHTRRRQELPPQPIRWFANLIDCLGASVTIRLAQFHGRTIAGILTLKHRSTVIYKYGASDERFHNTGAVPLLLWEAMQEAIDSGMHVFDFGRTDFDNPGLVTFKNRFGAKLNTMTYYRTQNGVAPDMASGLFMRAARRLCKYAPDACLRAAGRLLYKHVA